MLRMLSFNIHNGKRLDEVSEWIMNLKPQLDVFCLQEFPKKNLAAFQTLLDKSGYSCEFAPSFTKKGTTYGELTAYHREHIELVSSKVLELGAGRIDKWISRHNAKWTGLITAFRWQEKEFIITNIHLVPQALNRRRRKQLNVTLKNLEESTVPNLILGDFNYSSIIGKGGLIKFMAKHNFKIGNKKRVITHKMLKIPHQLDYVFFRNCGIRNLRSKRIKLSDHFPVFFRLIFS